MIAAMILAASLAAVVDTTRYRLEFTETEVMQASIVGERDRPGGASGTIWLRVVMRDTVDARIARVIVDSMDITATGTWSDEALSPEHQLKARGGVFEEIVGSGKTQKPLLPATSSTVEWASRALPALFPGRHPPLAAGVAWADTVDRAEVENGVAVTARTIANWRVMTGDSGEFVLQGDGYGKDRRAKAGQSLRVESTMRMARTIRVRTGEMPSSGSAQMTIEASLVDPQLPTPIPLVRKSTVSITRLK